MALQRYDRDTLFFYAYHFNKNHRAIAVAWAIMSIVFAVLAVLIFVQPQWIGDTEDSVGYGHLGTYSYCFPNTLDGTYTCRGNFATFDTILTPAFKATTVLTGLSALFMLIVVAALLLFFCFKKGKIFLMAGVLQIVTAIFMFLACVIYPSGWENEEVRRICGDESGAYNLGQCNVRWAYILAILGIFDALMLAILAFFLASKRAKIEMYSATGTVTKSELNGFSAESMSRKSVPIQPTVVAVPSVAHPSQRDSYSDYSTVQRQQLSL